MQRQSVKDIKNLNGKKVLVRVDFNVPLDKKGGIADDFRIQKSLPTIKYLLSNNARVVLCSHLGNPNGIVDKKYSLAVVAKRLDELLENKVIFANDIIGIDAQQKSKNLKNGEVLLLENLRFDKREKLNDLEFASKLAQFGEVFVFDAFGSAHRKHASTYGVSELLPSYVGLLVLNEMEMLSEEIDNPKRPFIAILGGAKISDKITVIDRLIDIVDYLIIGGGMAYTFVRALGGKTGKSLVDLKKIEFAKSVMKKAKEKNVKIILPVDDIVAKEINNSSKTMVAETGSTPDDFMALDIGPKTIINFTEVLKKANTVLWNGPLGVFEIENFENGTKQIAKVLSNLNAATIIGGGDTSSAVKKFGYDNKMTHISTGGGASLAVLEGKKLPALVNIPYIK